MVVRQIFQFIHCVGCERTYQTGRTFERYQTSIPNSDLEHDGCARVCHFALDLLKSVRKYNRLGSHEQIELRVGIATGQVVAGEDVKGFVKDLFSS